MSHRAGTPHAASDRSHTAPTCNYVSATLEGRLYRLDCKGLQKQIDDLVADHEPDGGWRFGEIDPSLFSSWCDLLVGLWLKRFDANRFSL
ncbi:FMN-binding negative transcriptional regulator [Rhizobium rhizogenes]|uniref:FMN-binding negative transcriptional regulator n=1 Tax=Rhizobium rhizogenes TaxID=359 RepID=UPI00386FE574